MNKRFAFPSVALLLPGLLLPAAPRSAVAAGDEDRAASPPAERPVSEAARSALEEADRLFAEAQAIQRRGNAEESKLLAARALDACERAIKEDPDLAAAYRRRGMVKELLGDFEGARADLKTYLVAEPIEGQRFDGRAILERLEVRSGYHSAKANPRRDLGVALTFIGAGTGAAGAGLLAAAVSESQVSNAAHDQALWDSANNLHGAGWVTAGVGAGVAVTGIVVWLVNSRGRRVTVSDAGPRSAPDVSFAAAPTEGGAAMGVVGKW